MQNESSSPSDFSEDKGHFLEIDNLELKVSKLNKNVAEEQKRLTFLAKEKSFQERNLEKLRASHLQLVQILKGEENQLEELIQKMQKWMEFQTEAVLLQRKQLEDKLFQMLEQLEEVEIKINDATNFLANIDQTIEEVRLEVQEEVNQWEKEAANLQMRIDALIEQLTTRGQALYQGLAKAALSPKVLLAESAFCPECHWTIPSHTFEKIKFFELLFSCTQCRRVIFSKY